MPYPARPVLEVLPQFRGDLKNGYNSFQLARFDTSSPSSTRPVPPCTEIGELTGRTQTAVRRSLDRTGTARRGRGAQPIR